MRLIIILALAFTLCAHGRVLMQSTGYNYEDGRPFTGFLATDYNFTLTAMNSTATATAHANSQNTTFDQCLLAGAYTQDPTRFIPGPLTVLVFGGQTSVVTLASLPRNRYQLYNVTEQPQGITSIATSQPLAPTSITFKPTTSTPPQSSTVLIGVFSGSDASARCLVNVTFTTIRGAPATPIPPLVAVSG